MSFSKSTILTRSGKRVNLQSPRKEDVLLSDVSHALARVNRFCGHTKEAYSVSQHSVLVVHILDLNGFRDDPATLMAGLLHDASEAYLGDVASPLKRLIRGYDELEYMFMRTIFDALAPDVWHKADWVAIKKADLTALALESKSLMTEEINLGGIYDFHGLGEISSAGPYLAETMFRNSYDLLTKELKIF